MQKLILPINKVKLTASARTAAYRQRFGFSHYGVDMVSTSLSKTVWGSGDGVVLSAGYDNVFGNSICVLYKGVYNHKTKKEKDVVLRYFHLKSIAVKVGDKVDINTRLGVYGNTGKYSTGAHLHVTCDEDTKYFNYEPGLKQSSNLIKKGNDKTVINPMQVFHKKITPPEKQTVSGDFKSSFNSLLYVKQEDVNLPSVN